MTNGRKALALFTFVILFVVFVGGYARYKDPHASAGYALLALLWLWGGAAGFKLVDSAEPTDRPYQLRKLVVPDTGWQYAAGALLLLMVGVGGAIYEVVRALW